MPFEEKAVSRSKFSWLYKRTFAYVTFLQSQCLLDHRLIISGGNRLTSDKKDHAYLDTPNWLLVQCEGGLLHQSLHCYW